MSNETKPDDGGQAVREAVITVTVRRQHRKTKKLKEQKLRKQWHLPLGSESTTVGRVRNASSTLRSRNEFYSEHK